MRRNTSLLQLRARTQVRILLLIVAFTLTALALLAWRFSRHETIYNGNPSSYWVELAIRGDQSPETLDALKALGPEAILPLLDSMQGADSIGNSLFRWTYGKIPDRMRRYVRHAPRDSESRSRSYMVLNRISDSVKPSDAPLLVPRLIPLLVDFDNRPSGLFVDEETHVAIPHGLYVRSIAAAMLASIGPNAEAAVPTLTGALRDPRWDKYFPTLVPEALGQIGPRAKSAVPTLKKILNESSPQKAVAIVEALWRIDPPEGEVGIPLLENALRDTNQPVRLSAARLHWKMKGKADVVLPVLLDLLRAKENPWRDEAWQALGEMGPAAREVLPEVKALARSASEKDAKTAQEALEKIESLSPASH